MFDNELFDLDTFKEEISIRIGEYYGEGTEVVLKDFVKNNGLVLPCATIVRKNVNVSPSICLDEYYKEYLRGESFDGIIGKIIEFYEHFSIASSYDISFMNDPDRIKEKIVYKLVNYEMNKALLDDAPHRRIMDLAMVYIVYMAEGFYGVGTALIRNGHMKDLGFDEEQLYEIAMKNTPIILPQKVFGICEAIEIANSSTTSLEESYYDKEKYNSLMKILTNNNKINGASCMLYPDLLSEISEEMDSDIIILPSSIHEVILLRATRDDDFDAFRDMVRTVNDKEVEVCDVLSNQVYFYDRKEKRLQIAK